MVAAELDSRRGCLERPASPYERAVNSSMPISTGSPGGRSGHGTGSAETTPLSRAAVSTPSGGGAASKVARTVSRSSHARPAVLVVATLLGLAHVREKRIGHRYPQGGCPQQGQHQAHAGFDDIDVHEVPRDPLGLLYVSSAT